MFKAHLLLTFAAASSAKYLSATTNGIDHPTLPTMWISETTDPPMGDGMESYFFVDKPTDDNPSAMWSNYTNPECKRLLWAGEYERQIRYLLKCDAVDCCKEESTGNQIEFQIPNVHPAALAKNFSHTPNVTILNTYGTKLTGLDEWTWQFGPEHWSVYTKANPPAVNHVTLYRWHVEAFEEKVSIDFVNFTGIAESDRATFKQDFQVPDQCKPENIPECDSLRKQGQLRPRPPTAADRLAAFLKKVRGN
jgi:hypothetical protein